MDSIDQTELKRNAKTILDRVSEDKETIIINRGEKKTNVVMLPIEEWNSLKETLCLLSTKANRESLLQSIEDLKSGKDKGLKIDLDDLWKS